MTEHVLVVGIDGVRYDVLTEQLTPVIDSIAERGFLAPVRVNAASPTISGPAWSTIVTGVLPPDHGVLDNDFGDHRLDRHPELITVAQRSVRPPATFVAAGWGPLVTGDAGGPMFAGGGYFPPREQAHLPAEWTAADDDVTAATVSFLDDHDGHDGSLVFSYLGGVDETGHLLGVGPQYREFVEASDRRLGELIAAIGRRPAVEHWTVIVVTDHGHLDEGGHGGDSDLERKAWIAAAGTRVPPTAPTGLEQADVAVHALAVLGLRSPSDAVIGRPFDREDLPDR